MKKNLAHVQDYCLSLLYVHFNADPDLMQITFSIIKITNLALLKREV